MNRFFYLLFALLLAMMSWEHQLEAAEVGGGPIPEESIRLRIIANSDAIQDQWLKREVRDAIIAQVNLWVKEMPSIEQARAQVAARLPELEQLVAQTIQERGFHYGAEVLFGQVEFPTKRYGRYVYPAGKYEALLVKLGEAKGQNWWCVLFPPLCFIDISNGDVAAQAEPASAARATAGSAEEQKPIDSDPHQSSAALPTDDTATASEIPASTSEEQQASADAAPRVEVRFFFLEKLLSLFGW